MNYVSNSLGPGPGAGAFGPLAGVRVLDIASVFAAPFGASLLADLGAEVLKVEQPRVGDALRGMQPSHRGESLVWAALARNKKAVTLDLRTEQGRALLLRLLPRFDILFENFRPGTLERWQLGPDELRQVNPNLIVVRVSGYGQTGPYRERAGFGTPATAFSGYTYISGYPELPPLSPPISLADYVTGIFAALGALSALYHRDLRGGDGQDVDVALYESLFRLLESMVTAYDQTGVVRERSGNDMAASVPAGIFRSADGHWLVLTTSTDRTFNRLADVMERSDMKSDPRYCTNQARVEHRAEVNAVVEAWFGSRCAEELLRVCTDAGVPVSPVYSVADIFADEHYAARGNIVEVEHATLGPIKVPGVVPKLCSTPGKVVSAGPTLGQHNREVYGSLGLTRDEISQLEAEGVL